MKMNNFAESMGLNSIKIKRQKIAAIIPCLNTEKTIGQVVHDTMEYVDEVVIVDDGSTDCTAILARAARATVISHLKNLGKGSAMHTGINSIMCDIIVFLDGDGQHNPSDIPRLIEPVLQDKVDFVVGSRFLPNSVLCHIPLRRKIANIFASVTISFVVSFMLPLTGFINGKRASKNTTRVCPKKPTNDPTQNTSDYRILKGKIKWITDCTSGFTAMNMSNWRTLNLVSTGFQIETEIIYEHSKNNFVIAEVPITCNWKGTRSNLSILKDGIKTLLLLSKKLTSSP